MMVGSGVGVFTHPEVPRKLRWGSGMLDSLQMEQEFQTERPLKLMGLSHVMFLNHHLRNPMFLLFQSLSCRMATWRSFWIAMTRWNQSPKL
jgi:hypothetical protein